MAVSAMASRPSVQDFNRWIGWWDRLRRNP
jgi:hypothetical protein